MAFEPTVARTEVLYIHPGKQPVGFPYGRLPCDPAYEVMPVGVIALLNLLREQGLSVRGLNYPMERMIDLDFDLSAWARDFGQPRLVLIDLHWYEHCHGALDMARACKLLFPAAPVVLGGLTASYFAAEILKAFGQVDFIMRGDAEQPLGRLAAAICGGDGESIDIELATIPNLSYRRDGIVVHNDITYHTPAKELDHLNLIDTDFLEHARHYLGCQFVGTGDWAPADGPVLLGHWLSTGRGCRFNCSFCGGGQESHRIISGRPRLITRSVEAVADDIEALRDRGVHQVSLCLDPMIVGDDYWQSLFTELSRRRIRIGLYVECFQLPTPEFIDAYLSIADLRYSALGISVLSMEKVRRMNGKAFSDGQLFRILSLLKSRKVPLRVFFSMNLPGETEKTLRRTLLLAERIARLYPRDILTTKCQPHTIDPCSAMSREPGKYDIEVRYRSFRDYYEYCRRTAGQDESISPDERSGFIYRGRSPGAPQEFEQAWSEFFERYGSS